MTMPIQSVDLYFWYGLLDMEWFGGFALVFPSVGDYISGTCKLLASEWEKS